MPPSDIFSLVTHEYNAGPEDFPAIQVNGTVYNVTGATVTCGFVYEGHFYLANNSTQADTGVNPLGFVPRQQIICQPSDGYQWGFSYQILLLVVTIHTLWSLTLYAVWLDGQRNSSLVKSGHRLSRWKAILELSGPLPKELGATTSLHSQTGLNGLIRRLRPVKYVTTEDDHKLVPEGKTIPLQPL